MPTLRTLSRQRFDAFVMLTRYPLAAIMAEELEWYADENEKV
jgi:hypothetical protein